jgi:hypothetical protein
MNIADELRKLQELHSTGALTDEEFAQAKAAVLEGAPPAQSLASQESNLSPNDPTESLTPGRLRTMQIVAGALLLGAAAFLGIVLYIVLVQNHGHGNARPRNVPIISLMAVAMLSVMAPLAFIVPRIQTRSALRRIVAGTWTIRQLGVPPEVYATDGGKLMSVRQTTLIVGLAYLQGSAFFGCIAYLLEAQSFVLGVIGVAVVLMLCKFPTRERVRAWLERQANALDELRQQQDSTAGMN